MLIFGSFIQDPPNTSYGSFFNVYLFRDSDKGAGMFTEYYQGVRSKPMPFIVLDDHFLVSTFIETLFQYPKNSYNSKILMDTQIIG